MGKILHKIIKKFRSPYEINIVGLVLGVLIIFFTVFIKNFVFGNASSTLIFDVITGLGASLVGGAILNILSEWRTGNILIQTVMDGIYQTAAKSRIVRYQQSINFSITDFSFEETKYLKFSCKHRYSISNTTYPEKSIDIDTFNDISIPLELNNKLGKNKTQFEEVEIRCGDGESVLHNYQNPKYSNEFTFDEYGRPRFTTSDLILKKSDETMTITFDINNIHKLKDKHSWYFEEITDKLTLIINNQSSYPINKFKLMINHPNRDDIEKQNSEKINSDGQLKILNIKEEYSEIKMNYVFLPYQGFEILWDIQDDS